MASGDTEARLASMRLLIANRGEIAVRIARTARRLGVSTVGVYSEPDRQSVHLDHVDVAVSIGGITPADSYLRADLLLDAAQRTGCTAVHPGYGFLAEDAAFAEAVIAAGLTWVGPTPEQIRLLGDKIAAKRAAVEAGVPTTSVVTVAADGTIEGTVPPMPVLVKAAAGGGGRGMRVVDQTDELDVAIAAARREAGAAFGDDTVFIEPYLQRGRHVEVQIFGDSHGTIVHLGDRECSIQRRNQKVIEEAPSPGIDDDLRSKLTSAAVALGEHVGYLGAGTVEFMVADDAAQVTFLEVNTRLQVEHPVTEAITGTDLVEWQLRVAVGDRLPLTQTDIDRRLLDGLHAIEVRLVAERPADGWLPSVGEVTRFDVDDSRVRVEAGIAAGGEVTTAYDSMLAKVISVDADRSVAAARLADVLRRSEIVGVATNAAALVGILTDADFLAGLTFTDYLDNHPIVDAIADGDVDAMLTALAIVDEHRRRANDAVSAFAPSGWRNLATVGQRRVWRLGDTDHHIEYRRLDRQGTFDVAIGDPPTVSEDGSLTPDDRRRRQVRASTPVRDDSREDSRWNIAVELDGIRHRVAVLLDAPIAADASSCDAMTVTPAAGSRWWHGVPQFVTPDESAAAGAGPVSPLPGTVIAVHVEAGDRVAHGDVLMVVEAMKMEHQIRAAADAVVAEVRYGVGDRVDAGDLLVALTTAETSGDDA